MMEWLGNLNPQPDSYIFFIERDDKLSELVLRRFELSKLILTNPFPLQSDFLNPFRDISFARQKLLNVAREHDADSVLMLDSDIQPLRSDLIEIFSSTRADIVTVPTPARGYEQFSLGSSLQLVKRDPLHDSRLNYYPCEGTIGEDFLYTSTATRLGYEIVMVCGYPFIHHNEDRPPTSWDQGQWELAKRL